MFRQGKVDVEETFSMTQLNAWLWMKYKMLMTFSFSNWNQGPIECLKTVI